LPRARCAEVGLLPAMILSHAGHLCSSLSMMAHRSFIVPRIAGASSRLCRALLACTACCVVALSMAAVAHAQGTVSATDVNRPAQDAALAGEAALECVELTARHRKALEAAGWAKDLGKGFGALGLALDAAAVTIRMAQGDHWAAVDEARDVVISAAACAASCLGWFVGKTLGEVIDEIPVRYAQRTGDTDLRTLNQRWTDALADVYIELEEARTSQAALYGGPSGSRQIFRNREQAERYAKALEIEQRLAQARRVAAEQEWQAEEQARKAEEQARRDHAAASSRRCSIPTTKDDPLRTAIDAMNGKNDDVASRRSAPLPRSTPVATGCDVLKDTRASERLSADDPDAYDALMARCL